MNKSQRLKRSKGATLLVTAILMAGVLPMVGLAIDASLLYTVKAKLSAAVDAAALAGARSLNRGSDLASQRDSAIATARAFFRANFPEGHLGTHNSILDDPQVTENIYKTRTVQITGHVDAPSYFLRLLGFGDTRLVAGGTASRRDVNLVLVLDRSGSMSGAMTAMKAAAVSFVDKFAEGRDNVGLVVYSNSVLIAFPPEDAPDGPESDFKTASPNVETLINQTVNGGSTETAGALWKAYQMLERKNEAGSLNLIVFFTDGLPNGVTGDYNKEGASLIKGTSPCQYKGLPARSMIGFIPRGGGIYKFGIGSLEATPSYEVLTLNTNGCAFRSNPSNVGQDVARFPSLDYYGNATNGPNRYLSVDLTRVTTQSHIEAASLNAADDAVQRIRQNTSLNVVIYSVGYSGGSEVPNETWMKRISNDPTSQYYTSTVPTGMYVKAPTTADLSSAFAKVASEILRLSM